jgi:hypothetical protein
MSLVLLLSCRNWLWVPCRNDIFEPPYIWRVVTFLRRDRITQNLEVKITRILNHCYQRRHPAHRCPMTIGQKPEKYSNHHVRTALFLMPFKIFMKGFLGFPKFSTYHLSGRQ